MKSLAAIAILITAVALPSVASARPHNRHGRHRQTQVRYVEVQPTIAAGAIARSRATGRIGWSYGYSDLGDAQNAAQNACGESDCLVVAWEQNGCAALAEGEGAWGSAGGTTLAEAEALATLACVNHGGSGCQVVRWVCN